MKKIKINLQKVLAEVSKSGSSFYATTARAKCSQVIPYTTTLLRYL